mmetsp:Transcript_11071/g.17603  ORF Transcript_11071/g.17603 Transcript_11071/m.17603 type:complete len:236 (-) Transcript_11071:593-1300(-)|eukprot:CAMPEP_0203784820 /NCGR_PEP_ID=MMETSP0100_2-20121128/681_1 /ASSEMBLY_ACC=CAM_ASM_000210 /TAXON_ID=96639 /ORGANISM=" , Strain NY0313808BC1" /LENGTH=235 /DNA_ID=CAMNT_0050686849 /DNA_START=23 /DNA_END=730 /DNA_ORIENTATION=-
MKELEQAIDDLVTTGFGVVVDFLPASVLAVLEDECNAILSTINKSPTIATDEFGCVIEPIRKESRRDGADLSSVDDYVKERVRNCTSLKSGLSREIATWIFNDPKLQHLRQTIFGAESFLYNEQYIVKPPNSTESTFAWHRDSDRARSEDAFVSFWIPLTDVSSGNGTLCFKEYESEVVREVSTTAGSLVMLSHDVSHKSLPNLSNNWRCAYMVQFSQVPILDANDNNVAYAIPC